MKKTTTLLAALLLAGGINARPYPQSAAPAPTTTQPLAPGVATAEIAKTLIDAAVAQQTAAAQQQYAQAEVNFLQAQVAQQGAEETQDTATTTVSSGNQNPFEAGNTYNYSYGGPGYTFMPAEQPHSALVVRTSETAPETLTAMKEDLNIMGRILEKVLSKSDSDDDQAQAMGIRLTGIGSGGGAKFLQIEGGGALFLLNVDFPLLGPVEKAPAEKTPAADSSTWNDAKRELYGRPDGDTGPAAGREEFDSKRVERLKTSVLEALKNAANMSHLPGAETVTVVINGGSPHGRVSWSGIGGGGFGGGTFGAMSGGFGRSSGGASWSATGPAAAGATAGSANTLGGAGSVGGSGGGGGLGGGGGSSNGRATAATADSGPKDKKSPRKMGDRLNQIVRRGTSRSSSVMTIRVAKTDIDAFAGGKIDLDDFRKKATITVY